MDKSISAIIIIVMTLGIISCAIMGQIDGIRNTADALAEEENRLETMLRDSNIVSLASVKNYISKSSLAGYSVQVDGKLIKDISELSAYKDSTLFAMNKTYDMYGSVSLISFSIKTEYSSYIMTVKMYL